MGDTSNVIGRGVPERLYNARWDAFDSMPREIREFLWDAPFPYSAARVKETYDHCGNARKTVEFYQARAARRCIIERATVWHFEELGATPIPPEPKMPRKARKSAKTLTLDEIDL